eukprot:scaffold66313_cov50-Attheya_sp.AAC.5
MEIQMTGSWSIDCIHGDGRSAAPVCRECIAAGIERLRAAASGSVLLTILAGVPPRTWPHCHVLCSQWRAQIGTL